MKRIDRGLSIRSEKLGDLHPSVAQAQVLSAEALRRCGDNDEARVLAEIATETLAPLVVDSHWALKSARAILVLLEQKD